MAAATDSQRLSSAIIDFSIEGRFPDGISALPSVSGTDLTPAIDALRSAKVELESTIHTINEDTKGDVSSWVKNAKSLQEDIIRSKAIANDIIRQSEAPDVSGEAIQNAEEKVEFLNRELQYSQQLHSVLTGIQYVNQLLSEVVETSKERRIIDSLQLLEKSWSAIDEVGASKTTRIMRLLDSRAFDLKSEVHVVLNQVWKALIQFDTETGRLAIYNAKQDEKLTLADAVIGLRAYKEVDERMEQFWRNLDAVVLLPRMNTKEDVLPGIRIQGDVLELSGSAESSADTLLSDLERVFKFVGERLPPDLLQPLCNVMMAELVPKIIQGWLTPAVPSGLRDMDKFQSLITKATNLCQVLQDGGYSGFQEIQEWADKAPTVWLEKCRETALSVVRMKLNTGIGSSKRVEKVEKQMVSLSEGKELATTGAGAAADTNDWGDDWGNAWDDDNQEGDKETTATNNHSETAPGNDDDDGDADAWGWNDNEEVNDKKIEERQEKPVETEDDDGADAWGWGDDGDTQEPETPGAPKPPPIPQKSPRNQKEEETRELIFKETYSISSMPEPVLDLIFAILEDGAALKREGEEFSLVAKTAPGLFSLPTFVLALFRAISPHYYSLDVGGNMFLYNDAMYLSEKLSDFSTSWKEREDLTPAARSMLRIDNDVRSLQNFANRSYANEMNLQKTVLQDLMGGSQSVMQQDEKEAVIESGTARIRTVAATWEPILRRSVWSQAIGSLADSLASRLITDILDLSSIGQEEAYSIAKLIASATKLDDLFLPSKLSGTPPTEDEVPTTSQYAPTWLRLKYLSEVLQSNLNEVKFLWCDSELSLYFSVQEVVDLINASFEDNGRTRETIREIRAKAPLSR